MVYREQTLKILIRLSPELLTLRLKRLISTYPTSSSHLHLEALVLRSLEVADILVGDPLSVATQGVQMAEFLWDILEAEDRIDSQGKRGTRVLERVVAQILRFTADGTVSCFVLPTPSSLRKVWSFSF